MSGRSSIERQPPMIRAAVHEAIHEGATIDEIAGRIRALGGTCSRSAVARFVKRAREMERRRGEDNGIVDFWLHTFGDHPEGGTGRLARESLRGLVMNAAEALEKKDGAPDIEKVAALALAMQRIESAGRNGANRGSARDAGQEVARPDEPALKSKGLSPETVAYIRNEVEGDWREKLREEQEFRRTHMEESGGTIATHEQRADVILGESD